MTNTEESDAGKVRANTHKWEGCSLRAVYRQTGKRHDNTRVLKGFGDASVLAVIDVG